MNHLRRRIGTAIQIAAACIGVFLVILPSFSQGDAGRIQGSIIDQSGGAVPGATVIVTDTQRGTSRTLTTDNSGEYNAPSLIPSTYRVHAEAMGFKAVDRENVVLEVNGTVRVDFKLQPGDMKQTITVTEAIPLVDTTNAEVGGALQHAIIENLPLNGRNFENLLTLRPGVTIYPGGGGWTQSTNGIRAHDNVYMVERVNSNDPWMAQSIMNAAMAGGDAGTILPIDAIDEFKSEINPKAEYGWKPGAVINVGVKSGTNAIHGSAYAYGRDGSWDARNYYNPVPQTVGALSLQQFGATVGGPVKKDKLFYFLSFEQQRYTVGSPAVHKVPITDPTNTADPNSLVGACLAALASGGGGVTALSAQMAGLTTTCAPITTPATAGGPVFPGLFPINNSSTINFGTALNTNNQINSGLARIDYHIGNKNSLNGMYFISPGNGLFVDNPQRELNQQWLTLQYARAQTFSSSWTFTPNSSLVNEVRVGYAHYYQNYASNDSANNPANYIYNGQTFNIFTGQTNPIYFGLPQIRIGGGLNLQIGLGWPKVVGPDGVLQVLDHVSYLRGKHAFKFGGEILDNRSTNNVTANTKGPMQFNSLQLFFNGAPATANFLTGDILRHMSYQGYALFVQDDWRIKPTLTLNLGLRYEINTVPHERDDLFGNFDPILGLVQVGHQIPSLYNGDHNNFAPRLGFAWDIGGNGKTVLRGGGGIVYEQLSLDVFNNIANFLGSRTVPTGAQLFESGPGGSVVQIQSPGNINTVSTNQSATVTANFPNNSPSNPLFSNAAACGDGFVKPPGFLAPVQPCQMVSVNRNLRSPYVSTWTFGIQRAITNNLSLEVTYVGNHGTKLISLNDINQPPLGVGWTTAAQQLCLNTIGTPNVICSSNRAAEIQAQPFTAPCPPPVGLGTPGHCFPYLSNIMNFSNDFHSNYNGLQVTMTQRTSHGLSFTAGYTYSHSLDNASDNWGSGLEVPINNVNPASSVYGSSNFDIRNRFTFSGTYLLPGKKGYGQMLEGWSVNTVVTLQGGQPWGVNDQTTDFSGTGEIFNPVVGAPAGDGIAEQWDFFGNPHDFTPDHGWTNTNGGVLNTTSGGTGGVPFFSGTSNAACLAKSTAMGALAVASLTNLGCYAVGSSVLVPPPYGTLGSTGRNIFTGPGFKNWDLSVSKEFKFTERLTAQFRAEFFNILNHPDFTNPFGGPGGGPSPSTDPSQGPGFGINAVTPDVAASNPVLGSGGARAMQLGLKLAF
jgi:hypothetical protein